MIALAGIVRSSHRRVIAQSHASGFALRAGDNLAIATGMVFEIAVNAIELVPSVFPAACIGIRFARITGRSRKKRVRAGKRRRTEKSAA